MLIILEYVENNLSEIEQYIFLEDVCWLQRLGIKVKHYKIESLSMIEQKEVTRILEQNKYDLPLFLKEDKLLLTHRYPSRAEMARWFDLNVPAEERLGEDRCYGREIQRC